VRPGYAEDWTIILGSRDFRLEMVLCLAFHEVTVDKGGSSIVSETDAASPRPLRIIYGRSISSQRTLPFRQELTRHQSSTAPEANSRPGVTQLFLQATVAY
jgi:hypothetical protein